MKYSNDKVDFSYKDVLTHVRQIESSEDCTPESKERQKAAVMEVYQYCENTSECRRVQVLEHFDETFAQADCRRGCDNCVADRYHETVKADLTNQAHATLRLIKYFQDNQEKIGQSGLNKILRGSGARDVKDKGHDKVPGFGSCSSTEPGLFEIMIRRLVACGGIGSTREQNSSGFHNTYTVVCAFVNSSTCVLRLIACSAR